MVKLTASNVIIFLTSLVVTVISILSHTNFVVKDLLSIILFIAVIVVIYEFNNRFILISKNYITLISLTMLMISAFIIKAIQIEPFIIVLCYFGSLYALFISYDKHRIERNIFYCLLLLTIASLICPPMLWIGVLTILSIGLYINKLTLKNFVASILGILVVIEIFASICLAYSNLSLLTNYLNNLFPSFSFSLFELPQVQALPILFVIILFIISSMNWLSNKYGDKLKIRMFLHVIFLHSILMSIFAFFTPISNQIFPLLIINTCFFTMRYIIYSKAVMSNVMLWSIFVIVFIYMILQ